MVDHISNERLAALLDDGVDDTSAREHLASCPTCRRELDLLRRMRMALSAMDELDPPGGQWGRIEARLSASSRPASGGSAETGAADGGRQGVDAAGPGRPQERRDGTPTALGAWVRDIGWLRAAAGIVLFAGGLGLGSLLGPLPGPGGGGSSAGPSEAADGPADRPTVATTAGETASTSAAPATAGPDASGDGMAREEILSQFEVLGGGDLDAREAYRNPTAAAERLARLDALVRAAREALEEDPADPAMNQFLFRVVEERQQLNQALHLASIDVR